jgi:2-hydroxychromene-2-carboxylate isomerase
MKKVDFYFDYLSPYSYFAWLNHCKLDCDFVYKPIAMGSLFSKWDMKGPGEILPKRIYMLKNCFKYAAKNNITFIPPKSHPFNPLYALRLSTSAIGVDQKKIIDILFKAVWQDGQDVSDLDFLELLLNENGFDAKYLIEKTFEREVKLEVKSNLKTAKEAMMFGVPSFKDHDSDDFFWGNDSLNELESYLNEDEPTWDKELFKERLGLI